MDTSAITESVFSLFVIILVGVYASRKNIITQEINKGLTDILIKIALPFMIVSSFMFTYDESIKANVLATFYLSLGAYVIMAVISIVLLIPVKNDKKIVLHFANVFVNTGYIGFPVLNSIYGYEGVIYGSIFNLFFVIFLWTYGILLYKGKLDKGYLKKEIINLLFNPSIIAVIIGIVIMLFNIEITGALLSSIKSIGSITGPLSMFIIGAILSKVKIKQHIKDWAVYYGIVIKLIVIPVTIYLFSLLLREASIAVYSVIIMTAMPASAMTSILAESYNKEKEFAAVIVSATTLISLITVPMMIRFMSLV
ncbi:AEC family transporter [Sedimentibacter hydroxybenzoicus DSM 7310]|uniref:AEC family transporter n=1 Tax=Sedimentibacter hydroxybenzoicus DSM 7310 TaxID=1123245 RepID=A0A974GXV5_SEDHY|nr:AEC family transporter [Sedimentibacter hydroxybenzoicus]NYB76012.1 AEC family transporter [Sedimentibacter hydroxybenzoicus DSM 7310]